MPRGDFLKRSGGATGTPSGVVTSVTASPPLQSSGGVTPNISVIDGTVTGQVISWSGSAWNTTERVIRATGIQSSSSLAFTSATTTTITSGAAVAITAATGNANFTSSAGNVTITSAGISAIQAASVAAVERVGGGQMWCTATGSQWYQNGSLVRTDTLGAAIQYQFAQATTQANFNFASKAAGTGASFTLQAGGTAGATGGLMRIRSGVGASTPGDVNIDYGNNTAISVTSGGILTLGLAATTTSLGINCGVSASATAGGAGPVPDAEGYINVVINGVARLIPYVNP